MYKKNKRFQKGLLEVPNFFRNMSSLSAARCLVQKHLNNKCPVLMPDS